MSSKDADETPELRKTQIEVTRLALGIILGAIAVVVALIVLGVI